MKVANRNFFDNTARYTYSWTLSDETGKIQEGTFEVPVLEPGDDAVVAVPVKDFKRKPGAVYMLRVNAHEKNALPYAEAGYECAAEQFVIEGPAATAAVSKGKSPVIQEKDGTYVIKAGKTVVTVDKATGLLAGYENAGVQMITSAFKPNFWRAGTDNDRRGWKVEELLGVWKDMASDNVQVASSVEEANAVVTAKITYEGKAELVMKYTVAPDGTLCVSYDIQIAEAMPEPLRIGLQGQVDARYSDVTYFGLGPWENYCDRHAGVFLGTYKASVKDMMTQYVYTQENGNRTGVRWLTLTDKNGRGVQVLADEELSMSVWNCTQDALEAAKHIGEAPVLNDSFVLNIDCAQAGVGGTDTWSIKARPEVHHRLLDKRYTYSFQIRPVNGFKDAVNAARNR